MSPRTARGTRPSPPIHTGSRSAIAAPSLSSRSAVATPCHPYGPARKTLPEGRYDDDALELHREQRRAVAPVLGERRPRHR